MIKSGLVILIGFCLTGCHLLPTKTPVSSNNANRHIILEQRTKDTLIIPVVIQRKTYQFLVDTGSSVTIIDDSLAQKITRPLSPAEIPSHYQRVFSNLNTPSGPIPNNPANFLKPVPFSIGTADIIDSDLWIARDLSLMTQAIGVKIDGIIGIDTFRKYSWAVDNVEQTLTLTDIAPAASTYQACTGYEDHYNGTPQIWFTYRQNHDVGFLVDTGASDSYIASRFIQYVRENKWPMRHYPLASSAATARGHMVNDSYVMEGFSFDNQPIGKIQFAESHNNMFALGMDFLSRLQRYAFIPSRMMFCYDATKIALQDIPQERNISIRYFNDAIEIFYNNDSQLTQYGLKNGDRIVKINGHAYLPADINKVRHILLASPRHQLPVTIERDKEQHDIVI